MKKKDKDPKDYCSKCGKKLIATKTGIMLRAESSIIDEPYDGAYKPIIFKHCKCWQTKESKDEKSTS